MKGNMASNASVESQFAKDMEGRSLPLRYSRSSYLSSNVGGRGIRWFITALPAASSCSETRKVFDGAEATVSIVAEVAIENSLAMKAF
jgi:hypothetical protein